MSEVKKKLISVIVPVYNIKGYIEKCIESLIGQTYSDLEIILVDDGSSDGSGQICDRYAEQDSRVMALHKENGGLSDARNYAIDRAHGDLLAFVDGDDWIHPQMYELMLGVMELQAADVVTCLFEQQNENFAKQSYEQSELNLKFLTGAEALSNIGIPLVVAWNKIYKKEIFDNIRYPKGKLHEDEYVIHRIFYKCRKIAVINKPLYFYTVRNDSIVSQMTSNRINNSLEAYTDRLEFADSMGWTEVLPAVVKQYCDYCIDMYQDIESGRYELIDKKYLNILWQSERNMMQRYPDVEIDKRYRLFAKSPEEYNRWLAVLNKGNQYLSRLRKVLSKMEKLVGIKR